MKRRNVIWLTVFIIGTFAICPFVYIFCKPESVVYIDFDVSLLPYDDQTTHRLNSLRGSNIVDMLKKYGTPISVKDISVNDCRLEYRVEVMNWYPPVEGNRSVRLLEFVWEKDTIRTYLWFHYIHENWVVLTGYSSDSKTLP